MRRVHVDLHLEERVELLAAEGAEVPLQEVLLLQVPRQVGPFGDEQADRAHAFRGVVGGLEKLTI